MRDAMNCLRAVTSPPTGDFMRSLYDFVRPLIHRLLVPAATAALILGGVAGSEGTASAQEVAGRGGYEHHGNRGGGWEPRREVWRHGPRGGVGPAWREHGAWHGYNHGGPHARGGFHRGEFHRGGHGGGGRGGHR
jgi:hypothetical protein